MMKYGTSGGSFQIAFFFKSIEITVGGYFRHTRKLAQPSNLNGGAFLDKSQNMLLSLNRE